MDSVGSIILYFVVAIVIVFFSYKAVTAEKILRAATYLLFVLIGTAVFYFQLGYQFLGAVQLAVYAGGIMVLFVFSILLTSKPDADEVVQTRRRLAGVIASCAGAVVLLYAVFTMPVCAGGSLADMLATGEPIDMHRLGHAMVGTERFEYLLPFEAVSVLLLACIIGGVVVGRKR